MPFYQRNQLWQSLEEGCQKARLGVWSVNRTEYTFASLKLLTGTLISASSVHSFKVTVLSHSSSNCIQLLHIYIYIIIQNDYFQKYSQGGVTYST